MQFKLKNIPSGVVEQRKFLADGLVAVKSLQPTHRSLIVGEEEEEDDELPRIETEGYRDTSPNC